MTFLFIILCIYFVLDLYTYSGLRSLFHDGGYSSTFTWIYIAVSIAVYIGFFLIYSILSKGELTRTPMLNWLIGFVFASIIAKLVFSTIMLVQDGGRSFIGLFQYIASFFAESRAEQAGFIPGRRRFFTLAATSIAAVPFVSMLYGISKGKYRYTVKKVQLAFKDLPEAFHGFTIAHITDIHSGSYDSRDGVQKGIDLIKAQKPDCIVFTGDLVNMDKDEIDPYLDLFESLEAPFGKYAVLGNHDYYGMYRTRPAQRVDYFKDFISKHRRMGFDLMLNEHRIIEKNGQSITLAGVENWGAGPFPKEGDLDKALLGTDPKDFVVLLSHDPTHWDHHTIPHKKHIHLTLSGHTHGAQFGINLPKFKWSPVQYRYKRWLGLYEKAGQYLYVNPGFGFLGFPGRVGIWPEVTVVELVVDR